MHGVEEIDLHFSPSGHPLQYYITPDPLSQLVNVARRCAGRQRGRERTHLLLIYPALVQAVALPEPRLREMVRDVLQLAGAELGLGVAT